MDAPTGGSSAPIGLPIAPPPTPVPLVTPIETPPQQVENVPIVTPPIVVTGTPIAPPITVNDVTSSGGFNSAGTGGSSPVLLSVNGVTSDPVTGAPTATPVTTVTQQQIDRLTGNGTASHEANAAAGIEPIVGTLIPLSPPPPNADGTRDPSPDYKITEGVNVGKTVDFMFTNAEKASFINANFDKSNPIDSIKDHLNKADITALDYRNLSLENQAKINNFINTLPESQKAKILIIR
jgi:hypothetical protein